MDTSAAGANVVLADGSVNAVNGSYVARIYDPESIELSEDGTAVTLKDESGNTVGEYAPVNDYMYLIVAGEEIKPGTYTLWQGDVQLSGSVSEMRGMMPMGGVGGGRGGRGGAQGETSTEFVIAQGGSVFANVGAAKE